ncbi:MAG: hypothetical protein ABMA15_02025 [Vicinamibacterales bacterium]
MGEARILETEGCTVTTERLIYGSKIVPIGDISHSVVFEDTGWKGALGIAGIGLVMIAAGPILVKLIGLLLLPGAYKFYTSTIERRLMVAIDHGDPITVKFSTREAMQGVQSAIKKAIDDRKNSRAAALRQEIAGLPDA